MKRRSFGLSIGLTMIILTLAFGNIWAQEKDAQVSMKEWTTILENKVAERIGDKGLVNYEDQYIEVIAIGAPPERYYGKPQARPMCIRASKVVAMRDILEIIQGVRIDSETTVKDYVVESDTIKATVNGIVKNIQQVGEPIYLSDGTCEVKYRMSMRGPFMQTIIPKAIDDAKKTATPPPKVKPIETPPGAEVYTGLVIDARGLGARPAMSPKIFDEEGREVYGSLLVSKEYAVQQGISGYARDLTAAQINPRVATNPITIKAISTAGASKSDLKINNQDAAKLLASKENIDFMKKCRVMIVLD
ncbi:MAG: hypothetical protein N2317_02830 [Syntrophales bacterium]|nr:hypothetical protein [Syntrophales bacterium]